MESNRRVVGLEPRKIEHRVVLKLLTKNSCGRDQHHWRAAGGPAVTTALFLLLLSVFYATFPESAQTQTALEPKRPALQIGDGRDGMNSEAGSRIIDCWDPHSARSSRDTPSPICSAGRFGSSAFWVLSRLRKRRKED